MGRPIVYCSECGRSLREEDFAKGRAGNIENQPYCSDCRKIERPAPPEPATPARMPAARTPKPFPAPSPRKASTPLIAAAAGGAALLILLVALSLRGGAAPPKPPPPKPPPVVVVPPPAPAPPPPKPAPVAESLPAPPVDPAEEERAKAARFDRYLASIREAMADARFEARREEIRAMLATAAGMAGARKAEVDALRDAFTKRNEELAPPKEAPAPPRPATPAPNPGVLVGHWKLDETTGDVAADSSGLGHTGKVVGKGAWAAAKVGGGFETSGDGEHVELPDSAALRRLQAGPHTLALWYKPKEVPAGADAMHALIVKPGLHAGLLYYPPGIFRLEVWPSGVPQQVLNGPEQPPGRFYHVAATVDPAAGAAALYVDGAKVKEQTWKPAPIRSYGSERWRIGVAIPQSTRRYWGPSKGILDDVRAYSRVLSGEEIRSLYESQR